MLWGVYCCVRCTEKQHCVVQTETITSGCRGSSPACISRMRQDKRPFFVPISLSAVMSSFLWRTSLVLFPCIVGLVYNIQPVVNVQVGDTTYNQSSSDLWSCLSPIKKTRLGSEQHLQELSSCKCCRCCCCATFLSTIYEVQISFQVNFQ